MFILFSLVTFVVMAGTVLAQTAPATMSAPAPSFLDQLLPALQTMLPIILSTYVSPFLTHGLQNLTGMIPAMWRPIITMVIGTLVGVTSGVVGGVDPTVAGSIGMMGGALGHNLKQAAPIPVPPQVS